MMTLEQIADCLEAAGITSPYSTDNEAVEVWRKANPGAVVNYSDHRMTDRLQLDAEQLPGNWRCTVHDIISNRQLARIEADADAAFQQLREPLRTVAQARRRARSYKPAVCDLSYLLTMNNRDGQPVSNVYKPEPRSTIRLRLAEAVQIDYVQASYANHSRYAIPVEGERPADLTPCIANLQRFCEAARTHNGFAGSGSSWTMELVETPAGLVVYADCRTSISD